MTAPTVQDPQECTVCGAATNGHQSGLCIVHRIVTPLSTPTKDDRRHATRTTGVRGGPPRRRPGRT